jgi:hypothetical protein
LITAKEEVGDIESYWHEMIPIFGESLLELTNEAFEGEALAKTSGLIRKHLDNFEGD